MKSEPFMEDLKVENYLESSAISVWSDSVGKIEQDQYKDDLDSFSVKVSNPAMSDSPLASENGGEDGDEDAKGTGRPLRKKRRAEIDPARRKRFKCSQCLTWFSSRFSYNGHKRKVHKGEKYLINRGHKV